MMRLNHAIKRHATVLASQAIDVQSLALGGSVGNIFSGKQHVSRR
jgi:hypothetical protein